MSRAAAAPLRGVDWTCRSCSSASSIETDTEYLWVSSSPWVVIATGAVVDTW